MIRRAPLPCARFGSDIEGKNMEYEIVIGLETHAELLTDSKLWCGCSTRFGEPANTQTCPICLGMPGVLPVMNKKAFELAVRAAIAMKCHINKSTFFDRKHYFYPDLPKNYQVSQNDCNLGVEGHISIPVDGGTKKIRIWNVHLEEDAGKNMHVDYPGATYSLLDLNRSSMPLLEIVSAPDMRSVEEAESFMQTLRRILLYSEVSDCRMQEGSLRFEASISLNRAGENELGGRVEIKNLNSMKAVSACLRYEIQRQAQMLDRGDRIERETRLWDETAECSRRMRSKEEAHDYRYFPEPDLIRYEIDEQWLKRLEGQVPELPLRRRERFVTGFGLSDYDASVLTDQRELADYYENVLAAYDSPKSVANWIMNDIMAALNERKIDITGFSVAPAALGELIEMTDNGRITARAARDVLAEMIKTGKAPDALVQEMGVEAISDSEDLAPIIRQAISEAPEAVEDYRGGKKQAIGAIVGQVMRLTRGQADAKKARELLQKELDEMSD